MDLGATRDTIKTALATISGLQVYDTVPANPEVPCAIVIPDGATYHEALDSTSNGLRFAIRVLVQLGEWASAQDLLDSYCSTGTSTSIPDAMEATDTVTVETFDSYGIATLGTENNPVSYGTVVFHASVLAT